MPEFVDGVQLYLSCIQCGEVFDSIAIAFGHARPATCGSSQGFDVLTEAEAF